MITYLKGKIKYKNKGYIVLDVHDVGYQVFVLPQLLEKAKVDSETELYTYQNVTENKVELYGFRNISELEFFEQLIQISGIGPKSALGVMNQASIEDIKRAIIHGDSSMLTRVSGIGKKTAERIILELKNKIDISDKDNKEFLQESGFQEDADAMDGLVSLGYSLREAREAIKHIPREAKTVEEKVKASLKVLGRK
ncbi:MAG: Holliday junction branch migration protein RuvA [Patescibacteria group bacterium]|jgi:Holliday junction DNA helicase RuvA